MSKSVFCCISAILFFIPAPLGAADIYIDADGGGTAPTIQAGIDMAISGDRVIINSGTYYEGNLVLDGKNIWIRYGNGFPILQAPTPGAGTGLTVRNVSSACVVWGAISFCDFDTAISVEGCSPQVYYCQFFGCGTGIMVSGPLSAPTIQGNLIKECSEGISVWGGSGVTIVNQTIVGCGAGITMPGGTITVSKNIIDGCGAGLVCSGASPVLYCNDLWGNTVDYDGCSQGSNDIFQMPMFCYALDNPPGDYWLHIDSPCWGRNNPCGVNLGAFTATHGCTGTAAEASSWGKIKQLYFE